MTYPRPTTRSVSTTAVNLGGAAVRGFMLDSARCQENRAYYRNFIDFAAARGVNLVLWHFTDDQGCSLQFDALPALASPNAYSKVEMRELIRYAGDRGIEIVPELASLGHSRYLTRLPQYSHLNEGDNHFTGMCPVSEETRDIMRVLIEETASLFDSPNLHVGLDEVNIGGHPLTRAALQTTTHAGLLADYANFIHGVVTSTGKRMWMWGDGLLKYPEMLERVHRDVLICNWQYRPDVSPASTRTLLDAGFDVMLCSALISHDQPLFPGAQFAVPNVRALQAQCGEEHPGDASRSEIRRGRVFGHIATIWTPVRFIADSLWAGIDLAAGILRDGPDVDPLARAREFAESFYGLNGESVTRFAKVVGPLLEMSPTRKEWLAVAKLSPLSEEMEAQVIRAAHQWTRAYAALGRIAPSVRRHVTEYRAFLLLIEVLAHSYDVASQVCASAMTPAKWSRLVRRGQAMLDLVDGTWDRERFADDSRKYTAPIAAFQDDHLVALLREGLTVLKTKYAAANLLEATVETETVA